MCLCPVCREVAGLGLLKLLLNSIGVHGVTGMDTMLAFRCSRDLGDVIKLFTAQVGCPIVFCYVWAVLHREPFASHACDVCKALCVGSVCGLCVCVSYARRERASGVRPA